VGWSCCRRGLRAHITFSQPSTTCGSGHALADLVDARHDVPTDPLLAAHIKGYGLPTSELRVAERFHLEAYKAATSAQHQLGPCCYFHPSPSVTQILPCDSSQLKQLVCAGFPKIGNEGLEILWGPYKLP